MIARLIRLLPLTLALLLMLPLAAQDASTELPAEIVVEVPGITPEGIDWDAANGRFLLGSLATGSIYAVTDDAGTTEVFIESDKFASTVGIDIDAANNRLLVPNSDPSVFFSPDQAGRAGLLAFDLETGEELFEVDLTAIEATEGTRYFANDVAVDAEGNAYVTNSFAPVIYRVDIEGSAAIFIEDERLTAPGIGLNGIVYHEDGYLLAAVGGAGAIFKIPVDDPAAMTQVELSEALGIDGMYLHPNGALVAIAQTFADGQKQEAVLVTSEDDWASATVQDRVETGGAATTITVREGTPYFINAYLGNNSAEQYEIVRVDFAPELLALPEMTDEMSEGEAAPADPAAPEPVTTEEASG